MLCTDIIRFEEKSVCAAIEWSHRVSCFAPYSSVSFRRFPSFRMWALEIQLFSIKLHLLLKNVYESSTFEKRCTPNNGLIMIESVAATAFGSATQSQLNRFLMMHFRQLHIKFHGISPLPPFINTHSLTHSLSQCKAIEFLIECAMSCHVINWWGHV